MSRRSYGLSTGAKVSLWIVGILVVLAAVFVGLYFGVPAVHDWVVELFTPEKVEEVTDAVESATDAVQAFIRI